MLIGLIKSRKPLNNSNFQKIVYFLGKFNKFIRVMQIRSSMMSPAHEIPINIIHNCYFSYLVPEY